MKATLTVLCLLAASASAQPGPRHGLGPHVSRDGKQILFESDVTGRGELFVMNSDGSAKRQVSPDSLGGAGTGQWIRNGKQIFFSKWSGGKPLHFVMDADGSNLQTLPQVDGILPVWSPNGAHVLSGVIVGQERAIYRQNADGSGKIKLTPDGSFDFGPSWSPDGRQIAFSSFVTIDGVRRQRIFIMNADGSGRRPLSNTAGNQTGPKWSPDGKWIAFEFLVKGDGQGAPTDRYITIADMKTGEERRVGGEHEKPYHDEEVSWFPDGKRLALQSLRDGIWNIYVIDLEGRVLAQLTK